MVCIFLETLLNAKKITIIEDTLLSRALLENRTPSCPLRGDCFTIELVRQLVSDETLV